MRRYEVIVPRLNVRKAPVSDFKEDNVKTTVAMGKILELDEVLVVPNPALGKWYTDGFEQYYSERGLRSLDGAPADNLVSQPFVFNPTIDHWWITDYGINEIWKTTKGAGVKIAIIDSGLDFNHSNIKNKKNIKYYNVITRSNAKEDGMDEGYHGTLCAGMIAAHGPDIFGVAPEADLLIILATRGGSLEVPNLISAIEYAITSKADIISISYSLQLGEEDAKSIELLHATVKKASANKALIVASSGNTGTDTDMSIRYPGVFEECLCVGAISKDKSVWPRTTLNHNLKILAPGAEISLLQSNNNGVIIYSGTSYSTPFVAGLCALYFAKFRTRDLNIVSLLQEHSTNKEQVQQQINQHINIPNLGVINPLRLFNI